MKGPLHSIPHVVWLGRRWFWTHVVFDLLMRSNFGFVQQFDFNCHLWLDCGVFTECKSWLNHRGDKTVAVLFSQNYRILSQLCDF